MHSTPTNIGYWEKVLQAPTPSYQKLFDSERKYLLGHIAARARVLDIGCGEGRNMETILEKTDNVVGIDNDGKAVEDARKHFAGNAAVEVMKADVVQLPFRDETFDVVTCFMILPNLDKLKEVAMKEIGRVLKKNGTVILSTFSEDAFEERMKIYKQVNVPITAIEGTKIIFDKSLGANVSEQFSKEQIETLVKIAGLEIVDIQKIDSIAYICSLRKTN